MRNCLQTEGQTILEHGEAVAKKYRDLISGNTKGWQLPEWFIENKNWLMEQQLPASTMETYQVFHDCGKPKCIVFDTEGKRHFPNHAEESRAAWLQAGGDPLIGELIRRDMDMHVMRPSQIKSYDRYDLVPSLLCTALAELHANASMFGGIESTSFKIKFKALSRLGNAVLKHIKEST